MMLREGEFILVGDIGGTNIRFGLAQCVNSKWRVEQYARYQGNNFPNFDGALATFLDSIDEKVQHFSLAVAGPLRDGEVTITHRGWKILQENIVSTFPFSNGALYNDFAAMARAIPELSDEDFHTIHAAQPMQGEPILVAGAGTGFGVSYITPIAGKWHVTSSEGGHMSYMPRYQHEIEIFQILQKEIGFVPLEALCSGKYLRQVHKAVCKRQGKAFVAYSPDAIRERGRAGDPVCEEVCKLVSYTIMRALGDLALVGGSRGGIVLAGGVSERMVDFLIKDDAIDNYFSRGSFTDYLKAIPIRHLKNPVAPLIGAAALFADCYQS